MGPNQEKLDLSQLQNRQLLVEGRLFKDYVHPVLAEPPMGDVLLPFPNVNMNSLNGEASPRITKEFAEINVSIVSSLCAI